MRHNAESGECRTFMPMSWNAPRIASACCAVNCERYSSVISMLACAIWLDGVLLLCRLTRVLPCSAKRKARHNTNPLVRAILQRAPALPACECFPFLLSSPCCRIADDRCRSLRTKYSALREDRLMRCFRCLYAEKLACAFRVYANVRSMRIHSGARARFYRERRECVKF